MKEAVIIDAVRTPVGKHGGVLKDVRSDDLAADSRNNLQNAASCPSPGRVRPSNGFGFLIGPKSLPAILGHFVGTCS